MKDQAQFFPIDDLTQVHQARLVSGIISKALSLWRSRIGIFLTFGLLCLGFGCGEGEDVCKPADFRVTDYNSIEFDYFLKPKICAQTRSYDDSFDPEFTDVAISGLDVEVVVDEQRFQEVFLCGKGESRRGHSGTDFSENQIVFVTGRRDVPIVPTVLWVVDDGTTTSIGQSLEPWCQGPPPWQIIYQYALVALSTLILDMYVKRPVRKKRWLRY